MSRASDILRERANDRVGADPHELRALADLLERDGAEIERLHEAMKRQAASAIALANATKAVSGHELDRARQMRAESQPELIESERAANARLTEELDALRAENEALRKTLAMLYDKWEDGNDCYQDVETETGFLGHAFKLSLAEEDQVIALIGKDAAIAKEKP